MGEGKDEEIKDCERDWDWGNGGERQEGDEKDTAGYKGF
jgi:hypothetical protein